MVRQFLTTIGLLALLGATMRAQDPPSGTPTAPPSAGQPQGPPQVPTPGPLDDTTAQALQRLATLLTEKRAELATARAAASPAATRLADELQALSWQFAGLAARENVQEFEAPRPSNFDLQAELEQLVRPLLRMLKDATSVPRQIEDLKASIEQLQERQRSAERALRNVERSRDALPAGSPARLEAERELSVRWAPTIQQLRDTILVQQANLNRLEEGRLALLPSIGLEVQKFLQTSGMSIVWSTLTFLAVFFGLRWLCDRLLRRRGQRNFSLRLIEVVLRILTVLLAVAATLIVPYARDDYFLLSIGIVFVLGAGWVVVRMAPQFVEQVRLVLNVGGVREGERILVDGLPFRVEALRFYTRLANPDLQGGVLRVPLQFLVGKRSRQSGPEEPWFPTRVGDHVLLADGTACAVRVQTPETVVVEHWGAPRSFPTTEFLRQSPRNLSRGFILDDKLRLARSTVDVVTTTARTRIEEAIAAALATVVPPSAVRRLEVAFLDVTANGFELLALAECDGSAAPKYLELRRTMQRAFVEACLAHGFALPQPLPVAAPAS